MSTKFEAVDYELKGLGGWLVLVGIGVVASPFRLVMDLFPMYSDLSTMWSVLVDENSEHFIPGFGAFLIVEVLINAAILIASVYLIFLFFSKSFRFPTTYIAIVVASIFFIATDAWFASRFFEGEPVFDDATVAELVRMVVGGLIWIPYLLLSKRVKVTFVEGL